MPLTDDDRELFLLDQTSDGLLAFYRSMYGSSSCSLNSPANCSYSVNMFTCNGEKKWSVDLAPFFSRPDHLEIQDIHYDGSTLYFNEACQSYSRESQGKCSSIVAIDPANRKLLWRSKPLVSNNRFEIVDDYILSAYAFTTESTSAYVIRRSDGKVMEQARVQANNLNVAVSSNAVTFSNYDGLEIQYRLHDSTTAKPKLKKEHEYRPPPAPPPTYHPPHWRPRPPIDF